MRPFHRLLLLPVVFLAFAASFLVFASNTGFQPLSGLLLPARASQAGDHAVTEREMAFNWIKEPNDKIMLNLGTNMLYFVREDGSEASRDFAIGSGLDQDGSITWLGMTYNPRTPEGTWMIHNKDQKNLYWVFGSKVATEQLFLRLWKRKANGELEFTHYGIHTTPNIEVIIDQLKGYGSYGCVLARYDLLKFIEEMMDYQLSLGEEGVEMTTYR